MAPGQPVAAETDQDATVEVTAAAIGGVSFKDSDLEIMPLEDENVATQEVEVAGEDNLAVTQVDLAADEGTAEIGLAEDTGTAMTEELEVGEVDEYGEAEQLPMERGSARSKRLSAVYAETPGHALFSGFLVLTGALMAFIFSVLAAIIFPGEYDRVAQRPATPAYIEDFKEMFEDFGNEMKKVSVERDTGDEEDAPPATPTPSEETTPKEGT